MKHIIDFIVALLAIVILSPIFLLIAILNKIYLGKPVLFIQKRPGLNGIPFNLIKFRTMKHSVDAKGNILPDAERLTRYGRFLRSTSLDELPGLWNVVKGDMAFVGPRPLLMEYLPLYSAEQARRHEVRPGITGWAQVNGRNSISWEAKFAADIWYVDHQNLELDFKILLLTVKRVLSRNGVSAEGEATMPKFNGNSS